MTDNEVRETMCAVWGPFPERGLDTEQREQYGNKWGARGEDNGAPIWTYR